MSKELIVKGTPKDRDDMIDFANYVFSHNGQSHDFIRMVPKLYTKGQNTEKYHYLIKEEDRIKAMICALPMELDVAGYKLKMNCVGTVSVHPYARGKGYMKQLMEEMLHETQQSGCVFSTLGGLRHRYAYFGYEKGGNKLRISILPENIKHCCKDMGHPVSLQEIKETDNEFLDLAFELHQKQEIKVTRTREELFTLFHAWESVPYAVMEGGEARGYLIVKGNSILELLLTKEELLLPILKQLFTEMKPERIDMNVAEYETKRLRQLAPLIESHQITLSGNYRIFDYVAFLEAFLSAKAKIESIMDGTLCLEIEHKIYEITVADGKVTVIEQKDCAAKTDVVLNGNEAVTFFTAPFCSIRKEAQQSHPFLRSWFPLPLSIPEIDAC
jgi:predicted N-acetyltransferase YhbS